MDALKFITCGSVDDGKSTLIGRLLVDTGGVLRGPPGRRSSATARCTAPRAAASTWRWRPTA